MPVKPVAPRVSECCCIHGSSSWTIASDVLLRAGRGIQLAVSPLAHALRAQPLWAPDARARETSPLATASVSKSGFLPIKKIDIMRVVLGLTGESHETIFRALLAVDVEYRVREDVAGAPANSTRDAMDRVLWIGCICTKL